MKSIKNKLMISLVAFFALSSGMSTVYADEQEIEIDENDYQELNEAVSTLPKYDFTQSGDWNRYKGVELTLGQALEALNIYKICYEKVEKNIVGFQETPEQQLEVLPMKTNLLAKKEELKNQLSEIDQNNGQEIAGVNKQREVIDSIIKTQRNKRFAFVTELKDKASALQEFINEKNTKLQMKNFYDQDATVALNAEDLTLTDINKILKKDKKFINETADQVKYELLVHAVSLIGMNTILKNHVKEENIQNLYVFYAFAFTLYEAAKKYRLNKIHEKFTSTQERVKEFLRYFLQESSHFASMMFIIALNKCLSEEQKESIKKIINAKTLAGTAVATDIMSYLLKNDLLSKISTALKEQTLLAVLINCIPKENVLFAQLMKFFDLKSQGPLFTTDNKDFIVKYAQNFIANKTAKKIWQAIGQKFLNDGVSIDLQKCNFMSSLLFEKKYFSLQGGAISSVVQAVEDYAASAATQLQKMKATIADNFVAST